MQGRRNVGKKKGSGNKGKIINEGKLIWSSTHTFSRGSMAFTLNDTPRLCGPIFLLQK